MQNLKYLELKKVVLIGASTGGPGQIQKIIDILPPLQNTSVVIAQHMALDFMVSFAKRVQETSHNEIIIPQNRDYFQKGKIYICQGATKLVSQNSTLMFEQSNSSIDAYNPNIDLIFNSFTPLSKELSMLCVILTGIGADGIDACKNLSKLGVRTLTESHASAIVDGMPSRARDAVADIEVDDITNIINKISEFCE